MSLTAEVKDGERQNKARDDFLSCKKNLQSIQIGSKFFDNLLCLVRHAPDPRVFKSVKYASMPAIAQENL